LDIYIYDDLIGEQGKCYLTGGIYKVRETNGHGAAKGSALHLAIVDRDDLYGLFALYGYSRTKLNGLTSISGTISAGDFAYGDTSGKKCKVLAVGADYCEVTYWEGAFDDGEDLTFKDSGGSQTATATLGTWDEGDFIEFARPLKEEWIEGMDTGEVAPGGAKVLPTGLYIRLLCYNAHATDELYVTVPLLLATE
jgi:hypothetical protein